MICAAQKLEKFCKKMILPKNLACLLLLFTRITPNTETFYAVYVFEIVKVLSVLWNVGILILAIFFPIIQFLTLFSKVMS